MNVKDIDISLIDILENSRVEPTDKKIEFLMRSIKQEGLKQPIGVGKTKSGRYVLAWGGRRLQAFKKLGYKTIPAVLESDPGMVDLLITNATENIQREDISAEELGRVCAKLQDMELSKGEISARLGVPKTKVDQALKIYQSLPAELRGKVKFIPGSQSKDGSLSASAAHVILKLRGRHKLKKQTMLGMAEEVRKNELTVHQLEIVGLLIAQGVSPAVAVKRVQEYVTIRMTVVLQANEMARLVKSHDISKNKIVEKIIYGELPPLSKPEIYRKRG